MIAHVDFDTGLVRQWMSYDAFGVMKVLRPGDFNGDGVVNLNDWTEFNAAFVDPAAPSCRHVNFRCARFLRESRSVAASGRFEPARFRGRVPGKGSHRRSCESSSFSVKPVEVERRRVELPTSSLRTMRSTN